MTIKTWIGAKRYASREGYDIVYYDFDNKEYGATVRGQPVGHFKSGKFVKHKVFYCPAHWSVRKMEEEFDKYNDKE